MVASTDNRYGNVLDPSGLSRLRADLKTPSAAAAKEVARQFESLLVQQMLKSMRAATPGDALFGGPAESQYRDLLDQQLAMNLAQGQGLGLAPVIERQLLQNMGLQQQAEAPQGAALDDYRRHPMTAVRPTAETPPAQTAVGGKGPGWASPEEFVHAVWSAAERTARKIGVSAKALVAQAALETGWGRHVIRKADGGSSFNLFGIKAHGWSGESVKVPTLEFRDGVAVKELASFRAYRSLDECFEDYARFLQGNPRYRDALRVGEDPEAFARALQEAGYATDPEYADKISRIMNGPALSAMLGEGETPSA